MNKSLSTIKNQSDLVIVATNSKGRVDLIQKLLELGHRKFIVEKMVCQSVEEYKKLLFLFKKINYRTTGYSKPINKERMFFEFRSFKHLTLILMLLIQSTLRL